MAGGAVASTRVSCRASDEAEVSGTVAGVAIIFVNDCDQVVCAVRVVAGSTGWRA